MRLEAGDRADRVGQQRDARQPLGRGVGQMLHQMLDGGAHAVAAGLAGDQQPARAVQPGDQRAVQAGIGIVRIGHLGLQRAVVLGPGVQALEDDMARALAAQFPVGAGLAHGRMQLMAPGAQLAVHRPDHQRVAALGFQRVEIGQHPRQRRRVARLELAGAHLRGGDRREGRDLLPRRVRPPEARMRDVAAVVGVERQRDRVDAVGRAAQQLGHPAQVGVRARHRQGGRALRTGGQVAEVVLRIDQQEVQGRQVRRHGGHDKPLSTTLQLSRFHPCTPS